MPGMPWRRPSVVPAFIFWRSCCHTLPHSGQKPTCAGRPCKNSDPAAWFFDTNTSGRIRKIIDDNASVTHTFLAHQMPDLAGSIMMPIASLALIFVFDVWLGLACLFPIITALIIMSSMMGKTGASFSQKIHGRLRGDEYGSG